MQSPQTARSTLAIACACALICGGCFDKKRPAPKLGAVVLAHPAVPAAEKFAVEDEPEILVEQPERVPQLTVPRAAPPRPKAAAAPVREPAAIEDASQPIIAPELSDAQLSESKAATQQSLSVAEHNLSLTQGKSLNPTQQDLVSKILGFVDSARDAMKNNDWQRARIQAKKAEVLSREFAPQP